MNHIWVAEATENSEYILTSEHKQYTHLNDVSVATQKWAEVSSSVCLYFSYYGTCTSDFLFSRSNTYFNPLTLLEDCWETQEKGFNYYWETLIGRAFVNIPTCESDYPFVLLIQSLWCRVPLCCLIAVWCFIFHLYVLDLLFAIIVWYIEHHLVFVIQVRRLESHYHDSCTTLPLVW